MTATERSPRSLGLDRLRKVAGGDVPDGVTGLSVDSRETERGHAFFALPGTKVHGAEFADYARRMGAGLIVTDGPGADWIAANLAGFALPVLVAPDARATLSQAAARWFGAQPDVMVAVTGTNGKTSVASFTRQFWEAAGFNAVNLGTTGVEGAVAAPLAHTTPEPITLHRLLANLSDQNITHAAMEASSHGLAQHRLASVHLRAAAFTNISRDHLDYHPDFADYFAAKASLFTQVLPPDGAAVVSIDDPRGHEIAALARHRGQSVTRVGRDAGVDIRLNGQRFDATGQDLLFTLAGHAHSCRLEMIGSFQAENALVAAGLAMATGVEPDTIVAAMPELRAVRGRMQLAARRRNGATVFVDYAHTPEALEKALRNLRPHVMGRVLVVFGAGGDRDPGKRAPMGAVARDNADVAFVTDDNPRTEDPATIRAAIMIGCPQANQIADRAEAILTAADALQPGDALLIAGKGHESGQIVGHDVYPFDDVEQASIAVAALDGLQP